MYHQYNTWTLKMTTTQVVEMPVTVTRTITLDKNPYSITPASTNPKTSHKVQHNVQLTLNIKAELALLHFRMVGSNTVVSAAVFHAYFLDVKRPIRMLNKPLWVQFVSSLYVFAPADLGLGVA